MSSQSMMSKKRFNAIKDALVEVYGEARIELMLSKICEIMKFDPNASSYDAIKEKLAQQKSEGVSSYKALNRKKYYETHKEMLNKKRTEARRQKST